jgi:ABC-2 type transport system permease protein
VNGTGTLLRLALRLDRVRLPIWVLVLAAMPAGTASQYKTLYPDDAAIQKVSGVLTNPSLEALNGPLYRATLGGLTTWKIGMTEFVLVALMSLLTVVRHTRAEEETGRLELVGSTVVGRYAFLNAALGAAGLASLAAGLLSALLLLATGLAATGAFAFGLAVALVGLVFAGFAAVAAQLAEGARAAIGLAVAALGVSFLLRAAGDTGPSWLGWLSPIGWAVRLRPYADERWWTLALLAALALGLAWAAYGLVARRDLGAGLLPERRAAATASAGLGSPFGLAWRLQRGILLAWVVGMAVTGLVFGGSANGIDESLDAGSGITDLLARLGGHKGITDAYLATIYGITGLIVAAYTVQATLRLHAEESSGRVEPLLATPVRRLSWVFSHLAIAVLGSALLLAVAGLTGGLVYGAAVHDVGGQTGRLLGAALVQFPATLVLAGLGVALFGLLPRFAALAWAGLIACFVALELGEILNLSQVILDISPFAHLPKLPGSSVEAAPLLWLTAVAVVLGVAGLVGFRRRDVGA